VAGLMPERKSAMRIAVLSDLHLSVQDMPLPQPDCDLVVLAGDIARPVAAIAWARRFSTPVIYVPGNHEFYGASIDATLDELRDLAADTNVHVLEKDTLVVGDIRFLGCTLWTDFRIEETEQEQNRAMQHATEMIRDFSRIKVDDRSGELFSPLASRQLFDASVRWLDQQFNEPFDGCSVVVTHHAPSLSSIHQRFIGSPLNAAFVSRLEHKVLSWQPRLWIHGHTHDTHSYTLGSTEVLCNPRGYAKGGIPENPEFRADLVIDI
jgi:Icc-related predicted phosphoesterase